MPVRRLSRIAPAQEHHISVVDQRNVASEPGEGRIAAPDRKPEAHAGHRPCPRFLRGREIGMRIDVRKADRAFRRPPRAQQSPEDDAAIATQQDDEPPAFCGTRHSIGQRYAILGNFALVPGPSRRTSEVAIRRRDDVAEIDRSQARDEPVVAENLWRAIEEARLSVVVWTNTDIRRRADDRHGPCHVEPHPPKSVTNLQEVCHGTQCGQR